MDILRITTAGSVDDGKSTLIGRLLFDTHSLQKDKLEAIESASRRKGLGFTDLSLITDGLIAEREQGITIDVAYIYFSTPERKFIISDTPGHIEYTRNMITGASLASVFLILIDARHGITEQTRRHFYIASLLRITEVAVCINKMDLVGFDESVFGKIKNEFMEISDKLGIPGQDIGFIPMSARDGDNVVHASARMEWYNGPTLISYLGSVQPAVGLNEKPARLGVQYVIRPGSEEYHDFRGYAGRITSGSFHEGDEVAVLPSLKTSRIRSIVKEENVQQAYARESVVVTLEDDIDVSRGNVIVKTSEPYRELSVFPAIICWMDEQPASQSKTYILQHGITRVKSKINTVDWILDIHSLEPRTVKKQFTLNDIGKVVLKLAKPILADAFEDNPSNGSFILIDEFSNNTVAVGFVQNS